MAKGIYRRKARKPGHSRGRGGGPGPSMRGAQRASMRLLLPKDPHPDLTAPSGPKPSRQVLRRKALLEAKR